MSVPEALYHKTENPLYVWEAIACPGDDIPTWCIAYLKNIAPKIAHLANRRKGPLPEPPQLSQALGLTHPGWSAFAEFRKDRRARSETLRQDFRGLYREDFPELGVKRAATKGMSERALADRRNRKRRLKRGRPLVDAEDVAREAFDEC
jgi:hypothetical protein